MEQNKVEIEVDIDFGGHREFTLDVGWTLAIMWFLTLVAVYEIVKVIVGG